MIGAVKREYEKGQKMRSLPGPNRVQRKCISNLVHNVAHWLFGMLYFVSEALCNQKIFYVKE
jgi:hypothetical protein